MSTSSFLWSNDTDYIDSLFSMIVKMFKRSVKDASFCYLMENAVINFNMDTYIFGQSSFNLTFVVNNKNHKQIEPLCFIT